MDLEQHETSCFTNTLIHVKSWWTLDWTHDIIHGTKHIAW